MDMPRYHVRMETLSKQDESIFENNQGKGIKMKFNILELGSSVASFTLYGVMGSDMNLYVEFIPRTIHVFSNDAFVTFLEFAENFMAAKSIIFYFPKESEEHAYVIKAFSVMGLMMLAPWNPLVHGDQDNFYLQYNV